MITKTYEGFFNFWKKSPKSKEVSLDEIKELFFDLEDDGLIVDVQWDNGRILVKIFKDANWFSRQWLGYYNGEYDLDNGLFLIKNSIKDSIEFGINYIEKEFSWKLWHIQLNYEWSPVAEDEKRDKKFLKKLNDLKKLTGPLLNVYEIKIRFDKLI